MQRVRVEAAALQVGGVWAGAAIVTLFKGERVTCFINQYTDMTKLWVLCALLLVAICAVNALPRVHPLDGSGSGSGSSGGGSSSSDGPGGGCSDDDDDGDSDRQQTKQAGANTLSLGRRSGQIKVSGYAAVSDSGIKIYECVAASIVSSCSMTLSAQLDLNLTPRSRSTPHPTCPATVASSSLSFKR